MPTSDVMLVVVSKNSCTAGDAHETVGWDFYGDLGGFAMMREELGIGMVEVRSQMNDVVEEICG